MSGGQRDLAVLYCVHDDWWFLEESIRSFSPAGPVRVFVSKVPWHGQTGDWEKVRDIAKSAGAKVVTGSWESEGAHRAAAVAGARREGFSHALIPDSDEVAEPNLLDELSHIARERLADVVHVEWETYWSSTEYVVRPREPFRPVLLIDTERARHVHLRHFEGDRVMLLNEGYGIVHHLSYCGPDERIQRKVDSWSHRTEVVPAWWEKVWLQWKSDRALKNLHPTHPSNYGFTERISVPGALSNVNCHVERPVPPTGNIKKWPKVSVCIPLYGGEEDIRACLASVEACEDLVFETIVVDNASPDRALEVVRGFKWVKVIENTENLGFARASNQAMEASFGDVVLFLNSDTILPAVALRGLLQDLMSSGTVGAVGPVSNRVGHFQQRPATYTSQQTISLFAEDVAALASAPTETDMLVGFCIAVRRSVLEEVGGFDESFGLGLFEDNDLCHRIRRAGYKLLISQRSFVHHAGSASFSSSVMDAEGLFRQNQARYLSKWRRDIESGFVDFLPGLGPVRIKYDFGRKPEALAEQIASDVARAGITLCMIVKNEERVIRVCLESAMPFFSQTVVVDTGSNDRTVEIARSMGAEVYEHPWEDSFAAARNHSLSYAKGKWVFWLDADDTLPIDTGLKVLHAALSSPERVHGFVVPVQFVEEGPGAGTRVDHVKLFRNLPGIQFEGRIHEQILGSLRKHGGEVARLDCAVLHSGYDTSEEGQARKRERDERLLRLDLADRPNHPFVHFNIGMTAHFCGEHDRAVSSLRTSIGLAADGESHTRKAFALLAGSLRAQGDDAAALAAVNEGLEKVGDDPELHFIAAQAETALGRFEAALDHYGSAVSSDVSSHFSSMDIGIHGFKARHNSGVLLAELGRYSECKDEFEAALTLAPTFLHSAFALFESALKENDYATAARCLDHVRSVEGCTKNWCEMQRSRAEQTIGRDGAALALEAEIRRDPGNAAPRLALAKLCYDDERPSDALAVLAPLVEHGIAEAAFLSAVCHLAMGDFVSARSMTLIAHRLNPGHAQTVEQLRSLNTELGLAEGADVA